MSKTSKIILVTIIATCILLGLGYAAITNITLNIAGSASANADQANFKVRFIGTPAVSDPVAASAKITADHTATISVQGLTTAGQFVTATYEIKNESQDLSGDLKVETTNSNKEYFTISSKLDKSSLKAGESTTALVTVKLTKTPIDGDVSSNIGVTLTAMPVEPGKEGTSVGTNDFSSSPINRPVNEYGFYYGEAYTCYNDTAYPTTVVFYEEYGAEIYSGEYLFSYYPSEKATYSENFITIPSNTYAVTDNGEKLINHNNAEFVLNDSFMDRQEIYTGEKNPYGFYYDVPYVLGLQDESVALVFHKDSTMSNFQNGVYSSKDKVTYAKNQIKTENITMPVYKDGNVVSSNNVLAYKVRPNFNTLRYVYITKNTSTGKNEYLTKFPDTHKVGDMYAVGDHLYTYTTAGWKIELIVDGSNLPEDYEFNGKTLESYQYAVSKVNNIEVVDASNLYAGCTNLTKCKTMPGFVSNVSGMFDGCTSLKQGCSIGSTVTNVTNLYRGCTSLEGEISIFSDKITEYAGCFEGVDMSKITLTGSASNATKNKLGSTGLNYEMLPEDE